jgi:dTDP-4-dehydrorhamnose 3,5-epimerase
MKIIPGKLKGIFEINLSPFTDERGFFMRTYDLNLFNGASINKVWVQENHSLSKQQGVLRGLHFQLPPFAETKLVRCISGSVLDVFVDLRKDSPTFGQWDSIELSAVNKKMIFIPRGFAHGFCTLSENSEVLYKVDNFYSKEHERGLIWNDTEIGIEWPLEDPILSEKDKTNWTLAEFVQKINGIEL